MSKLSVVVSVVGLVSALALPCAAFAQQPSDQTWQNATGALPAQTPYLKNPGALPAQSSDPLAGAVPGLNNPDLTKAPKRATPTIPMTSNATGATKGLDWSPSSQSYPSAPSVQDTPHVDLSTPMGRSRLSCGDATNPC